MGSFERGWGLRKKKRGRRCCLFFLLRSVRANSDYYQSETNNIAPCKDRCPQSLRQPRQGEQGGEGRRRRETETKEKDGASASASTLAAAAERALRIAGEELPRPREPSPQQPCERSRTTRSAARRETLWRGKRGRKRTTRRKKSKLLSATEKRTRRKVKNSGPVSGEKKFFFQNDSTKRPRPCRGTKENPLFSLFTLQAPAT